jgi:transposase
VAEPAAGHRTRTKITPEMDGRAAEMYRKGDSLRHIAKELGCSYGAAGNAVRRGGVQLARPGRKPRPLPDEVTDMIVRCAAGKRSASQIADLVNVEMGFDGGDHLTPSVVRRVLRDRRVPYAAAPLKTAGQR